MPDHLSAEDWRAVPIYRELGTAMPAMRAVPERVGQLVLEFLADHQLPGNGWLRT